MLKPPPPINHGGSGFPVASNCCSTNDHQLFIEFSSPERSLADCSVDTGSATLIYPEEGSGVVTVCVDLPTSSADNGFFEVWNQGDFTSTTTTTTTTTTGNITQLCKDVSYPELNEEGKPIGYEILTFQVVPIKNPGPINAPAVQGISGSLTEGNSSCDCGTPQNYIFRAREDVVFGVDQTYNFSPGTQLSNVLSPTCNLFTCFRDPATTTTGEAYILMFGELNVDVDFTIGDPSSNFLSTLTMGPDAKVNVLSGATLNIKNTEINGCREMWDAITVKDGGTLIVDESIIIAGEHAITVEDGGKLLVERSDFYNNYVSIHAPPQANRESRPSLRPEITVLGSTFDFEVRDARNAADNFFVPSPYLLTPYFGESPRAAGEFKDVLSGITFSNKPGNGVSTANRRNLFQHLENGLIFDRSRGSVNGSLFQDIPTTDNVQSGNGVLAIGDQFGGRNTWSIRVNVRNPEEVSDKEIDFKRMNTAVRVDGDIQMTVEDTDISEVEYGLYSIFSNQIRFRDNYVQSYSAGFVRQGYGGRGYSYVDRNIFDAETSDAPRAVESAGIILNNIVPTTTGFSISRDRFFENDLRMNGATFGLLGTNTRRLNFSENDIYWPGQMYRTFGVALEGGIGPLIKANVISGNTGQTFTETSGIVMSIVTASDVLCNSFNLIETGVNFIGNGQRTKVAGNNFNEGGIGLLLGDDSFGNDDVTVIGPQVHQANRWVGPFQGYDAAFFTTDPFQLQDSEFTVDNQDDAKFLPASVNSSASSWFNNIPNSSAINYQCPSGTPPNFGPDAPDSLSIKIVKGEYTPPGSWEASEWLANYRLYRSGQVNKVKGSDYPDWNTWLADTIVGVAADYYAVEKVIAEIDDISDSLWLEFELEIDTLQQAYTTATEERYQDTLANISVLDSLRAGYLDQIDNLVIAATPVLNSQSAIASAKVDEAIKLNEELSGAAIYLSNQQSMNAVYLDVLLNGHDQLNTHETSILSVANQCPWDGGEAVYQARALAAVLGHSSQYDDVVNCLGASSKAPGDFPTSVMREEIVELYPNPASNILNFNAEESKVVKVVLHDALGKTIRAYDKFGRGVSQGKISLPQLVPGVYVIRLELSNTEFITKLINIQ